MKWLFYLIVFVYMFYRAVYGADGSALEIVPISYPEGLNYLPSGSRLTVTCKSNNRNQKVEWLDPKEDVITHDTTNRLYSHRRIAHSSVKTSPFLLTFTHAVVDDSGVYTCQSDKDKKDVALCVIDAARFVDTPKEEFVDEGRSFTLTCQARGEPQPELVWSKDQGNLEDNKLNSKYKIFEKFNHDGYESLLTVTSLTPEDSGIYKCTAVQNNERVEDCSVIDSINITLQVNYAPVFDTSGEPTMIFANYNESVNIDCSASAFPKPTYRWFHDVGDSMLYEYPVKQIKLLQDENIARLTLVADSLSFGQKFTCKATNDLGENHNDFVLAEIVKPDAPIEVDVSNSSHNEITFMFTFNKDSSPFDVIQAQYKSSVDSDRKPRETEWRRGSRTTDLKESEDTDGQYKLVELDTDTKYWVRFRTKNDLGYSPWSDPYSVITRAIDELTTTEETNEETTESLTEKIDDIAKEVSPSDGTFYGIFFAGGILVLAVACMFAMRLV
ncbi:opioid-binding protein/cell adhesion molecule homolog [Plodia interpunctella]|uniref:opioid-binding protein/cell adhesion molecule homolog n=1 Tax=Plodia interpunctella TaxID=58824 RepID=UPI0023674935|nr:opioid-binding protein/cell adhesion molecule homolog [Plodia interpunctella]